MNLMLQRLSPSLRFYLFTFTSLLLQVDLFVFARLEARARRNGFDETEEMHDGA